MPFRAIASALLLPPSSLALVALVGLILQHRRPRLGGLLLWVSVLGLLVLAMPITGGTLLAALENDLPLVPPPDAPPQAIVILGGDVTRSGRGVLQVDVGPLSLERLRAGAELYRRTNLPLLVSGGTLREDEPPVAKLMTASLEEDFHVPVRWTEATSRDTWENARMTTAILQQAGVHSIYLVTQAWHLRRALIAFAGTGLTVTVVPTRMDRLPLPEVRDFIPTLAGWQTSYIALHEWVGCAFYALR